MTEHEFDKLRFEPLVQVSASREYAAVYESIDFYPPIRISERVLDGRCFSCPRIQYRFKGIGYERKQSVINAINRNLSQIKINNNITN